MNKNTEKKAYIAPQMSIIHMDTKCRLLDGSFYYQERSSKARAVNNNVNDGYTVVDFD